VKNTAFLELPKRLHFPQLAVKMKLLQIAVFIFSLHVAETLCGKNAKEVPSQVAPPATEDVYKAYAERKLKKQREATTTKTKLAIYKKKELPRFQRETQLRPIKNPEEPPSVSVCRERKNGIKGHPFDKPLVNKYALAVNQYACRQRSDARQSPALFGVFLVMTILAAVSVAGLLLALFMKRRTSESYQSSGTSK